MDPPTQVGPYRIERRLGSGGMGVVYLGRDGAGNVAAVKLLRSEYATDPRLRARLRREVEAARRVPRFCTAPVLAADIDADQPWLATEYIHGPTLDMALLERGRLTGEALETFAVGVAVALQAIHRHGVVHRDLKPSNILLSPLGPRVIDFGIARLTDDDTPLTLTNELVGTPAYLAPEQLPGGGPVTAAVDVYAWAGVVVYAATGQPPFPDSVRLPGVIREPPDLGAVAGPLRDLVTAALAPDPAARPSADQLVDRLSRLAPTTTTRVLATAAAPPAPLRSRHRIRRRLAMVGAFATILVVGLAVGLVVTRTDRAPASADDPVASRELANASLAAGDNDQRRAMELALDAWAAGATPEARGALLSAATLPYAGQLGDDPGGTSVAVDPAGAVVAVGHLDGSIQLWDVASAAPLGEPLTGTGETVQRLAFSPDGTRLASASIELEAGVQVWEVPSGRLVRSLPGLGSVAWLPDGEAVVATLLREDAAGAAVSLLGVWSTGTGQELHIIPTGEPVLDLAVSADGERVAGGHADGTATVWRLADGGQVAAISGHQEHGVRVALAPSGELATVGAEGEIRLWELPSADTPHAVTDGTDRTVGRLTFTPDGYLLATGGGAAVQWWEPRTGWPAGRLVGHQGAPFDVAVSADGKLVAATGTDAPTVLWRRASYWLPHRDPVLDVAYSATGDRLAAATGAGVQIWDPETQALTGTSGHADQARSVAYAPDGTLAATFADGTVRLDHPDGQSTTLAVADGLEARDAAFSPAGGLLAVTASPDLVDTVTTDTPNRVYLWRLDPTGPPRVLYLGPARAYGLGFTPDGSRLLVATHRSQDASGGVPGHSELRSWRTGDLAKQPAIDLGEAQVIHVAVSPDGATAATAGDGRTITLHDLTGDRPVREIGGGHPAAVRQLAYSPDGHTLATVTTDDGLVRLWDQPTGALVAVLIGHDVAPNAVGFSLASADPDGWVGLWPTDPADAIDRLCHTLRGPDRSPPHHLCSLPAT